MTLCWGLVKKSKLFKSSVGKWKTRLSYLLSADCLSCAPYSLTFQIGSICRADRLQVWTATWKPRGELFALSSLHLLLTRQTVLLPVILKLVPKVYGGNVEQVKRSKLIHADDAHHVQVKDWLRCKCCILAVRCIAHSATFVWQPTALRS